MRPSYHGTYRDGPFGRSMTGARATIDLALDRATEAAYRAHLLTEELTPADLLGWDPSRPPPFPPARARAKRVGP